MPVVPGTYYLRNEQNDMIADIEGPTMANGTEIHQWSFHGDDSQKWRLIYNTSNQSYTIRSLNSASNYYLSVENGAQGDGQSIVLSTSIQTQWKIESGEEGFKIISYTSGNTDYVLATSVSNKDNGKKLIQGDYVAGNNSYRDEWDIIPARYGTQTFRELDSSQYNDINCHGYAMMRDDNPQGWDLSVREYIVSEIDRDSYCQNTAGYVEAAEIGIAQVTDIAFRQWLTDNNYTWVYEPSFTGNGENTVLSDNQYRVVMRIGSDCVCIADCSDHIIEYDYHFWYQIYDGRWANKHGTIGAPELLPEGTTPFSSNTSGWNLGSDIDFYDSPIYSYIITIGA